MSGSGLAEYLPSDYPTSLISLVKPSKIHGVGFGLKKTEVAFPVSKYLALIGVFEKYNNINKITPATKKLVKAINTRTYMFSNKQVYSTKKINFNYT